jgi:hypothetical protein
VSCTVTRTGPGAETFVQARSVSLEPTAAVNGNSLAKASKTNERVPGEEVMISIQPARCPCSQEHLASRFFANN